jgi:hypothetical protein
MLFIRASSRSIEIITSLRTRGAPQGEMLLRLGAAHVEPVRIIEALAVAVRRHVREQDGCYRLNLDPRASLSERLT